MRHTAISKPFVFLTVLAFAICFGDGTAFAQATFSQARHETVSQRQILVNFSQNVTVGSTAGWTVTLNGSSVPVTSVSQFGGTGILVTFDASGIAGHTVTQSYILPSESINTVSGLSTVGVRISYDNTLGDLTSSGGVTSFVSKQSFNNLAFSCSELSFRQQGVWSGGPQVDNCIPVVMNFTQYQFNSSLRWRNSSTFLLGASGLSYNIAWGDGTFLNAVPYSSDNNGTASSTYIEDTGFGGNPGIVLTSRPTKTYPSTTTPAPDICSWDLFLRPIWQGSGAVACNGLAQTTVFNNWDTDNANTGTLNLPYNPPGIGETTNQICLGSNLNMKFSDQTSLNCRVAAPEANKPNQSTRHIRVVYGSTNYAAPGNIPDVRVGGVQVTSDVAGGGVLIAPYNANPILGGSPGYVVTGAGGIGVPDFNGVIELATPVLTSTLTTYMQQITTLSAANQAVGQRFYVRLDYWDVCNPYNAGSPDVNRVSIENYDEIIPKPTAPISVDKNLCQGQTIDPPSVACASITAANQALSFEVSAASVTGSTSINWYFGNPQSGGVLLTSNYGTNCRFFRPGDLGTTGAQGTMRTNLTTGVIGTYSLWATQTNTGINTCESDPVEVKIVVNQLPVVTSTSLAAICSDVAVSSNFPASSNATVAATYNVTGLTLNSMTVSAGGAAVANGLTASALSDDAFTNTFNNQRNVVYTVVPVSGVGCAGSSFTVTVPVNPEPVVSNQTRTICSDAAVGVNFGSSTGVAASTYNVTGLNLNGLTVSAGGAAVANGLTNTALADDAFTNTTNANVNVVYTVVPVSASGCLGNAFTVTVTVRPEPVVANQTPATICSDATVGVNFGSSTSVAASTYNVTGLNLNGLTVSAGGAAVANGLAASALSDDSFTNTTNAQVNVVYTVVPVSAAGCQGNAFTVTVPVNPEPVVANQAPSAVCSTLPVGVSFNTSTNGVAASTYNITALNLNGLTVTAGGPAVGNGLAAGALADDAYNNTTSGVVNVIYTVTPVSALGCPGNSFTVTVPVNPQPVVANQNLSVCTDAAVGVNFSSSSSVAAASYNVTALNLNGLTVSAGGAAVANGLAPGALADDAFTNNTGLPVNVIYTVVPVSASNCLGNSFTLTVTVNPKPVGANAAAAAICSGNSVGYNLQTQNINSVGNSVPSNFSWLALVDNGDVTGESLGANTSTTINDVLINTSGTDQTVTYTVTPTSTAGSCAGSSFTVSVLVRGPSAVIGGAATQAICAGNTLNLATTETYTSGSFTAREWSGTFDENFGSAPALVTLTGAQLDAILGNRFLAAPTFNSDGLGVGTIGSFVLTYTATDNNGCFASDVVTINVSQVDANILFGSTAVTATDGSLNATACSGVNLFLDGNASGGTGTYVTHTWTVVSPPATPIGTVLTAGSTTETPTFNFSNTTNADAVFVLRYFVQDTQGCNFTTGAGTDITITVKPQPVVANQTPVAICSRSAVGVNFNASTSIGAATYNVTALNLNGLTVSGGGAAVANGLAATALADDAFLNTTAAQVSVVYTVVPVSASGCAGNSFTVTVPVNPQPVVAAQTPAAVCSDSPVGVNFSASTGVAAATYNVTALNLNGLTVSSGGAAVANGLSAADLADDAFTNTTAAQVSVIYTVVPVSALGCQGASFTVTVPVNPEPLVANQTPTTCSDVAVGVNFGSSSGVAAATYNVTALNLNGLTVSGGGAAVVNGLVAADLANDAFTNTTNANVNVIYTVVPVSATGCLGNSFTVTVTVRPEPVVAIQTPAAVCSDSPVGVNFNASTSVAAATYNVTALNLNGLTVSAGGAAVANGLSAADLADDAFTNITNAQANVIYTVVPVSAAGCSGNAFTVTVPVNPEPVVAVQTRTVCSESTVAVGFNASSSVAAATYNVTALNLNGLIVFGGGPAVANGLLAADLTDDSFTNATASPVNVVYTVVPVSSLGCQGTAFTVTVTVNPKPIIPNQTSTICSGNAFSITPVTGGATVVPASTTYTWPAPTVSPTPGSLTGAVAQGAGVASIGQTLTNTTNVVQTATYTVTPTSGAGCAGSTFQVSVDVNPKPVIPAQVATICSGSTFTVSPVNGGATIVPGGTTYSWGAPVVTGGITGGSAQTGQASISQTLSNPTTAIQTATYTVTPTSGAAGLCVGSTFQVVVTVNPIPVLSSTLTPSAICSGTFSYSPASATAGATFSWSRAFVAGINEGASAGNGNISETLTNPTTAPVPVTYVIITSANGCDNSPGQNVTVTVNPTPLPNAIIGPANVCVSPTTFFYQVTPRAGATYSWLIPTDFNVQAAGGYLAPGPGTGVAGAFSTDYFVLLTFATATTQSIQVIEKSADGCIGLTNVLPITVSNGPSVGTIVSSSGATSFCKNQTGVVFEVPQNASSNFIWTTNSGATIIGPSAGTNLYQIIVDFNNSPTATINVTEINLAGCPANYNPLIISLVDAPIMTPATASICSGAQPSDLITLSTTPAVASNFTWVVKSITANVTGAFQNDIGTGPLSHVPPLKNISGVDGTIVYTVTPTATAAPFCIGLPLDYTVTVKPEPVVTAIANQSICPNSFVNGTVSFPFTSNVAGATFDWTNSNPSIGLAAASGSGNISFTAAENLTGADIVSTINVTASANSCTSTGANAKSFTITVKPRPVVTAIGDISVCPGDAVVVPAFTANTGGGESYAWTNNNTSIGLAATGSGNIASFFATNVTGVDQVATISVKGTLASCEGPARTFTITVKPQPIASNSTKASVCSDLAFNFDPQSNITNGVASTFSWVAVYDGGSGQLTGGAGSGVGNISESLNNVSGSTRNAVYTITPRATVGLCFGATYTITVPVLSEPVGSDALKTAQCSDVAFSFNPQTDITNGVLSSFAWTAVYDGGSGFLTGGTGSGTGLIAETLTNLSGIQRSVVYTITPISTIGSCAGSSYQITVPVNPEPVGASNTKAAQCSGAAFTFNPQLDITNGVVSSFTWTASYDGGSGLLTGGAGSGAGTIAETLNNTSSIQRSVVYTITPTASAGSCVGSTFTITVPINPKPSGANASKAAQCSDVLFSFNPQLDITNGVASTFAWTAVYDGGSGQLTGGAGSGTGVIAETITNISGIQRNAVYTVTPTAITGGCVGNSFIITIPINPEPVGVDATKAGQCSDVAFSFNPQSDISNGVTSSFTWTAIYDGGSGLLTGGSGAGTGLIAETLTNLSGIQRNVVYIVTPVSTVGGCAGSSFTITVPVNSEPVGANATKAAQCSGVAFTFNPQAEITNGVASTYTWTAVYDGNSGFLTGGAGTGTGSLAETLVNLTGVQRSAVYTITPSAGGCIGSTFTITVPVNPQPVGANSTKAAQCSDVAFSFNPQADISNGVASTFTWTAVYDGGSGQLTGGAGSGTNSISETITNLSGATRNIVYTVVPRSSGGLCFGTSFTITVPVQSEPVGADATKTAQCSDVAFSFNPQSDITNGVASTFAWTAVYDGGSGLLTGGAGSGTGMLAETLTNLSGVTRNAVYTVTPTSNTGTCVGTPFIITIPVRSEPVGANSTKAAQCSGVAFTFNPQADITNGVTSNFAWTAVYDGGSGQLTGGANSGTGSITETLTNLTSIVRNAVYTITPTSSTGSCVGSTYQITVPVNPQPVGSASTKAVQCSDVAFSFDPQTNITNAVVSSFTWTAVYDGGSGQLTGGSGSGTGLITETLTNQSGTTRNAVYTVTPRSTAGLCFGSTFVITVPVQSEPLGSDIARAAQCSDVPFSVSANNISNGMGGTSTYQWSLDPLPGGLTIITPGPGSGANITGTIQNLTGGQLTATYTVVPKSAANCEGDPYVISVPINPEPVASNSTEANQCSGVAFSFNAQNNITNGITSTFTWMAVYDGSSGFLTGGAGSGSGSIAETLVNLTGIVRNAVYTVTPTATTGSCVGSTFTITVPINPQPVGANATKAPQCSDVAFSFDPQSDITNGLASSFTWTAVYDLSSGLLTGGAGSGTGVINETLTNLTGTTRNAVYTVIPRDLGTLCFGSAFTITVPIRSEPVGANATKAAQCSNVAFSFNPQSDITNGVTSNFAWTAVYDGGSGQITGGAGAGTGLISETLVNLSGVARNAVYTVVPTSQAGLCVGTSYVITVPINPEPVGANSTKADQCSGVAFSFNPQGDITNGVTSTFTWTAVYDGGSGQLTGGTGNGTGNISETLTNLSGLQKSAVYTITPRASTGNCVGSTYTITVPVNPQPVGTTNTKVAQCSDVAFSFNPQSDISNAVSSTFTWTAVYDGGSGQITGGAGSGTGLIAETLTNTSGNTRNAVYTVIPRDGTTLCFGAAFTITVPIKSEPVGTATTRAAQCSDVAFSVSADNVTNGMGASSTYTWVRNALPGGLTVVAAGTGTGAIAETLQNLSGGQLIATYTVTPRSSGGCDGDPYIISVPINSEPVGADITRTAQCSDVAFSVSADNITNGLGATSTYTWVRNPLPGGLTLVAPGSGTGAIAETIQNLSGGVLNATYTVTPRASTTCVGDTYVITVPINPEPVAPLVTSIQVCSDEVMNYSIQTNIVDNTGSGGNAVPAKFKYTVTSSLPAVSPSASRTVASIANITDSFTNLSTSDAVITYLITPISLTGDCEGTPFELRVTVHPEPVGISVVDPVCSSVLNHNIQTSHINAIGGNSLPSIFTYTVASSDAGAVPPGPDRAVASSANITDTYTNTSGADVTITYTITPFNTANPTCAGTPFTYKVTISSKPVGAATTVAAVCSDATFSINPQTFITNGVTVTKFDWTPTYTSMTSSVPSSGTATLNATGSITGTFTNVTTIQRTATFTITPYSGNCPGLPFVVSLPIDPKPVIDPSVTPRTVCSDTPSNLVLSPVTGTTVHDNYDFTLVSVDGDLTADPGNSAVGAGLTASAISGHKYTNDHRTNGLMVVYHVRAKRETTAGLVCQGDQLVINLEVLPEPVMNPALANVSACSDADTNIELTDDGISVGATSFYLNSATLNATNIGGASIAVGNVTSGSGNALPNANPITGARTRNVIKTDDFNLKVDDVLGDRTIVYNITPKSGAGCFGDPFNINLAIKPEPVIEAVAPAPACSDVPFNVSVAKTASSVAIVQYNVTSINWDVTPTPGLGKGASNITVGLQPPSSTLTINDTYTNTTEGVLKAYYVIVPISADNCSGDPDNSVVVDVSPVPTVASDLDKIVCSESNASIVITDTRTATGIGFPAQSFEIVRGGAGALSTINAPALSAFYNGTSINAIQADAYANPTNNPIDVTYSVVAWTGPGLTGCASPQKNIVLKVEPEVKASFTDASAAAFCSGLTTDILLTSPTQTTPNNFITFDVTFTGSVLGASPQFNKTENSKIEQTLNNTNNENVVITYSIKPKASGAASGVGCEGDPVLVPITVLPRPKLNSVVNKVICEETEVNLTLTSPTYQSTSPGSVFFTYNSDDLTGDVTGETDGTKNNNLTTPEKITDNLVNNVPSNRVVSYTITPGFGTCVGDPVTVDITVAPRPVITPLSNFEICSGSVFDPVSIGVDTDASTTLINWSVPTNADLSGESNGAGNLFTQVLFNNSDDKRTLTYTFVATNAANSPTCAGSSVTLDVTVYPVPQITGLPFSKNVCFDETVSIPLTSTKLNTEYIWTVDNSGNANLPVIPSGGASGSSAAITQKFTNTGTDLGNYQYTITPFVVVPSTGDQCLGTDKTLVVNVAPQIIGQLYSSDGDATAYVCKGSKDFMFFDFGGLPLFEYTYTNGTETKVVSKKGPIDIVTVQPEVTTTYTLLKVKDGFGCISEPVGQSVTVNVGVTDATFAVVGPEVACSPYQVQFQHEQVAGVTYTWKWFDGVADSTYLASGNQAGQIVRHTFFNPAPNGTVRYKVYLEATLDSNFPGGCLKTTFEDVKVFPTPAPAVFADKTVICSDEPVTFVNSSQGISQHRWFYRVQGTTAEVDLKATPTVVYNLSNTTTTNPIVLEVVYQSTNGNCVAPDIITPITVYRGVDAAFTNTEPTTFVGGHSYVTFNNSSQPVDETDFRYEWDFGLDANPAFANTSGPFDLDYTTPGPKEISLLATNKVAEAAGLSCANEFKASIQIVVPPLIADFVAIPLEACFPTDVTVVENLATGDIFEWRVYDDLGKIAATSNANLPVFQIPNPGKYTIELTTKNSFTGDQKTDLQEVVIYSLPVASFDLRPNVVYVPDTELNTFNFSSGATEYEWDFGDGSVVFEEEPKYKYKIEGVYDILLIAKNDHGNGVVCVDSLSRKIVAKQGGVTRVPNAFTPNPNGPNGGRPGNNSFNDVFLPQVKGAEEFNMQIFDRWGNLIFESNDSSMGWDGYDRNGKILPAGVYVYKLTLRLSDGQRTTQLGDITMIR